MGPQIEPSWWSGLNAWVAAAWAVELGLYVSLAWGGVQRALARLEPCKIALGLTLSALIPYLAYAPATGLFQPGAAAALAALAAALAFWYLIVPRHAAADAGFLVLVAGVVLARVWKRVYLSPGEWPPMEALGQLMWIRLGVAAALVLRRAEGVGFGWLPTRREWRIGATHFLAFVPVGVGLGLATGFVQGIRWQGPLWRELAVAAGTFVGMLWVVALAEEFFFRGLLQRWASQWMGSAVRGWVAASVLFGLAHLPFRGFPNWRFALLATAAGLFYGRAYLVGGGIRAAMVAHALTNTVWRTLVS